MRAMIPSPLKVFKSWRAVLLMFQSQPNTLMNYNNYPIPNLKSLAVSFPAFSN
jgi:hypothetical protein